MKIKKLHLWPHSLMGQTIALLILALLGFHLISFLIFADERRLALLHEKRENSLGRIVSLVHLLEKTPPDLHPLILEATHNARIHFQLADQATLQIEEIEGTENSLQQRLLELLGEGYTGKVFVQLTSEMECDIESTHHIRHRSFFNHEHYNERIKHEEFEQEKNHYLKKHEHHKVYYLEFIVSIALPSGQWLNIESHHLARPSILVWSALFSTLFLALILAILVIFMVRRISRPLVALTEASEKLGRGEITLAIPETGPSDIRQSIHAFNQMNQRLQRFVQDRTRMLAAISHDLRTPITTLRLRAEFIEDSESRTKILATLDEMQAMTEATLAFAREAATQEDTRRVDLNALVASLCDDLLDMGQDVKWIEIEAYPYACRPVSLKRALRNLIENAIRYGQQARVSLQPNKTAVQILIEDNGPGIPIADLERVFEPFVRLEDSRNRETGGMGLGLSIARSIIHGHGGDITLNNPIDGGLQVSVILPLNP
jgi:signal transduction histidine kinase